MKTKKTLIAILVLFIVGVLAVLAMRYVHVMRADQVVEENGVAVSDHTGEDISQIVTPTGNQCFYQETPTDGGVFSDRWTVKLAFEGDRATGSLLIQPAEKDSGRGTLNGTVAVTDTGYVVDAIFDYMIEGYTGADQRIVRVTRDGAYLGYGELVEQPDGVLRYKDPANLSYIGPIPSVPCDSLL